jgi:hypothetical protein
VAKRLGLLHDLVPKAVRIGVLVNPSDAPVAEAMLRDISNSARTLGLQIQVLNASTSREIEAAFTTIVTPSDCARAPSKASDEPGLSSTEERATTTPRCSRSGTTTIASGSHQKGGDCCADFASIPA